MFSSKLFRNSLLMVFPFFVQVVFKRFSLCFFLFFFVISFLFPLNAFFCAFFVFSFLQVVFFFLRTDKDNVLCRQPDKNVTFATMNHKYLETGWMTLWLLSRDMFNSLLPLLLRPHESILACSILYWFWEFRAHHSLHKYLKTKVNNVQSEFRQTS